MFGRKTPWMRTFQRKHNQVSRGRQGRMFGKATEPKYSFVLQIILGQLENKMSRKAHHIYDPNQKSNKSKAI